MQRGCSIALTLATCGVGLTVELSSGFKDAFTCLRRICASSTKRRRIHTDTTTELRGPIPW